MVTRKGIVRVVILLLLIYLALVLLAYRFQERMIFFPTTMPKTHDYTYNFCQNVEEVNLMAPDGAVLNGVHTRVANARGVVLYFHGNGGNVSHQGHVAALFAEKEYDAIFMDYRTYGKSTGKLSEDAIYGDAELFYGYALSHYPESSIILYGRSFGTAVASYLAGNKTPKKVVLEAPFYSAMDLGKHRFPILPVKWLSRYDFPSHQYLKTVQCPIYVLHGTADNLVPYQQGKRLYESIPQARKFFIPIKGAGHSYLQDFPEFKNGMERIFGDAEQSPQLPLDGQYP